jgi:mono/diheme cytochrome c family protein
LSAQATFEFVTVCLLVSCMAAPVRAQAAENIATAPESAVDRGRYLVQAANCVSCHTVKDGALFSGGKSFETTYRFLGDIYSSNITPDRETGLGNWTEEDFIRAMRFGVARGGKHLFPAFPYTSFTKLATDDIKAIYAYLRTVPAAHAVPPVNSFWFRQRWVMVLWNALFFSAGELAPDPSQSDEWNRGHYLAEALGHCGACHTPRNLLLAERAAAALTGGVEIAEVESGRNRIWSAPNLTSAQSGLAKWSTDDLQRYLRTGNSRRAGALGPMNDVIGNSLRYLTNADVTALVTYIKSIPANWESPPQTLNADERVAGQALYDKHCEECHLSTGRGGLRKAPPVAGNAIVQARDAASLVNVIVYGAGAAEQIPTASDAWEEMSGFKDKMSDAQIALLANFLRSSWGNRGERVSPGFVAAQR